MLSNTARKGEFLFDEKYCHTSFLIEANNNIPYLVNDIWLNTLALSMSSSSSPETIRRGGTKVWKEMLIHGGAKDPKEMIHAVLGREPSVDPFFQGIK